MAIYDIIMLAIFCGAILFGLWKGLAWQVASLASVFVSYFVALELSPMLASSIAAAEPWNRFAAMLILFLGTSLVIWLAYGYLKKTIEQWRLKGWDTQAGGLLGAFKGGLLCMVVTLFAVTLFGTRARDAVMASSSGGYIAAAIDRLNTTVPPEIHAVLNPHVQEFKGKLDPEYLSESQKKFDEKIGTIRGTFNLPSDSSQAADDNFLPSANQNAAQQSLSDQLNSGVEDLINTALQNTIDPNNQNR